MRRIAFILLVSLLFGGLAAPLGWAQPERTLTPEACVQLSMANNPLVRAAKQQEDAAWATYHEARTQVLPTLSGQGSYLRLSPNVPSYEVDLPDGAGIPIPTDALTIAPSILDHYTLQASLRQPLFTGLRLTNEIRASRYQARAQLQGVRAVEAEVAYEVRVAYWRLVEARAREEVVRTALRQIDAQLGNVRARFEQGMALRSDVLAIEARRGDIRLQQIEAATGLRMAQWQLSYLTGLPSATVITPAVTTLDPEPVLQTTTELVRIARQQRPDVEAAARTVDAREAGVRAARSGWMPKAYLTGTYYYARPNPYIFPQEERFEGTWEIGVTLGVDLWTWGRTSHQVQQAKALAQEARERRSDVERRLWVEVAEAKLNVEQAVAVLDVAEQRRQETSEVYRVMRQRHQQGMALTSEVLAAEWADRQAELQFVEAQAQYAIAEAALDRAVGAPFSQPR